MKKSNHIVFTVTDEKNFSLEIKRSFPLVSFIDNMSWESSSPPTRESISDCDSKFVYLWERSIYPNIVGIPRGDGRFQGPQSGIVIQFIRPILKGNVLLSGELAVGFEPDTKMADFVKGVWKILHRMTRKKLVQVDPKSHKVLFKRSDIRAGDDAIAWCNEGEDRYLMFNNSPLIFLKPES